MKYLTLSGTPVFICNEIYSKKILLVKLISFLLKFLTSLRVMLFYRKFLTFLFQRKERCSKFFVKLQLSCTQQNIAENVLPAGHFVATLACSKRHIKNLSILDDKKSHHKSLILQIKGKCTTSISISLHFLKFYLNHVVNSAKT